MKKYLLLFPALALLFGSCKSSKVGTTKNVEVRFLDEYIIPDSLEFKNTLIGGLSGFDFYDGKYYLVSDHPSNPRFYEANIQIEDEKIDTLIFSDVFEIRTEASFLEDKHLDLEGIRFSSQSGNFIVSSEGSVKNGKDPGVFIISPEGEYVQSFVIPEIFLTEARNNGVFEGISPSFDESGYWIASELPLKTDGPKPKLIRTKSPVRITLLDKNTKEAVKQFPYMLEPVAKIPWLYFAVNGITDILEYAPNKFLVLERGFAAGHGQNGNTVRIFDVDASLATNTLDQKNLKVSFYNPAKKELIYDFKWAKKYLSQGFIDNIEGFTLGPVLSNGKQSLLLISDNNFNSLGKQINQVILMEIVFKK